MVNSEQKNEAALNTGSNRRQLVVRVLIVLLAIGVIGIWLARTPEGLLGKADAVGYAVCHRIDLRSFQLGDRQLPLCARCTGMFLGSLIALVVFLIRKPRAGLLPPTWMLAILVAFGVVWAFDGVNSYLHLFPNAPHLYTPHNAMRLITGALVGLSIMSVLYPIFNQTVWREWREERALGSPIDLIILLLVVGGVQVMVLTRNPLLLFPLGIMSSVGVVVLLTMAYSILTIPLIRGINRTDSWRQLIFPVLLGLTLAIVQIAVIDAVRFQITGNWDGFHI